MWNFVIKIFEKYSYKTMIKEEQILKFARGLFLRKSLYYSVLIFLLLLFTTLIITGVNYLFFPPIKLIQSVVLICGLLFTLVLIILPLKFLIFYFFIKNLSNQYLAKVVRSYDEGRLQQSLVLNKQQELGKWSSRVSLRESQIILKSSLSLIKLNWPLRKWSLGLISILILSLLVNGKVLDSSKEIFTGYLRPSSELNILPDTIKVPFNTTLDINNFKDKGFYINQIPNAVVSSFTVKWMFQDRFIKDLFIKCDSTVHLNSWYAVVEPPVYSSMNRYNTKDTIEVLLGSKIELVLKGVLTNQLRVNVPRETLLSKRTFRIKQKINSIDLIFKNQVFTIPVKIKEDLPPVIEVQNNTIDSVSLFIHDDFGVKNILINDVPVETNSQFIIYWNSDDEIIVKAFDKINQITVKTIKKPHPSFNELNSTITKNTKPVLTSFNEIKKQNVLNKDFQRKNKLFDLEKTKAKTQIKNNDLNKNEFSNDSSSQKLTESLDELWEIQKLITVLEQVTEEENASLDSVLDQSINELEETQNEELKEELQSLEKLEKKGDDRKKQAEQSAEKLKELLSEKAVDIQIDNINRLKRLLKTSWNSSLYQEINRSIYTGSKYRNQRQLLKIEQSISDTLGELIITDPMMGMVLGNAESNLKKAIKDLESRVLASKDVAVQSAYMFNALNELNAVLYRILESEKSALAKAKKECKNGQPGSKGKPNKGKKGENKSKKTSQSQGKQKGKKGTKRKEGKQGDKLGENGKGTKELLKKIDELLGELPGEGKNPTKEKIEELKKELLFNKDDSPEQIQEIEKRLWESLKSKLQKESEGESRKSNTATDVSSDNGVVIKNKPSDTSRSTLPLPVLKKK